VDLLDIEEVTGMMGVAEIIQKTTNVFPKFEPLYFRETDQPLRDIPQIADEDSSKCEKEIPFLFMPRDS